VDFSLTEEQQAVRDLTGQILEGRLTPERRKEVEGADSRIDRGLWADLAAANLLAISLPEALGGSGLGFLATYLVLEQIGRAAAPVPYLATVVLGALPIAAYGTDEQRARYLPPVVAGDAFLTAALVDERGAPATAAVQDTGGQWRLTGAKTCVPAGMVAAHALVPAATTDGASAVFVVDLDQPAVARTRLETTSGSVEAHLDFDAAAAEPIAAPLDWITDRATVGLCAMAVGVCEEAVRLTAEYTKTRHQFDKPIASFQAVGQRAAEAYIDTEAVRLTALQAAWRIDAGLPAAEEIAVAKFWAAEGGQRVVHAAQHLHGGIGVDRDYPLHRCFLWAKELELSLGGAGPQLRRLGALLAAGPA
jgi:alkylation response protein AidB-like acyl-CoA dehydrogenase